MISREFQVKNRSGLHARPCYHFVKCAMRFKSNIAVLKDGCTVDAKSIMAMICTALVYGEWVKITAEGEDEREAVEELGRMMEQEGE